MNFLRGSRMKLMCMFPAIIVSSSLTQVHAQVHDFQLLVQLQLIEITFLFVLTHKSNESERSLGRSAVLMNRFLKLPDLLRLTRRKSLSLSRNITLGSFGILLMEFLIKVNLPYLLYFTSRRCCLLHLIKETYLP